MSHNGDRVLSDTDWRDANISTLPEWHPAFYEVEADMQMVLQQFRGVMERYKQLLLDECSDPLEYLEAHIQDEVLPWISIQAANVASEVWKQ